MMENNSQAVMHVVGFHCGLSRSSGKLRQGAGRSIGVKDKVLYCSNTINSDDEEKKK